MAAEDDTEEENAVDAGASESETKAKDLKMKVDRSVLATGILDSRADVSKVESDKIVRFSSVHRMEQKKLKHSTASV